MTRHPSWRLTILLLAVGLASCRTAPVGRAPERLDPQKVGSSTPRLCVDVQARDDVGILSSWLSHAFHSEELPVPWRPLLAGLDEDLRRLGVTVVAFRHLEASQDGNPFLSDLQPTLVASLQLQSFSYRTRRGASETGSDRYLCRLQYRLEMRTYPERRMVRTDDGSIEVDTLYDPSGASGLRQIMPEIASQLAVKMFPLEWRLKGAPPESAPAPDFWYSQKTAVLPLDNETVSVDGPVFVREALQEYLKDGGYAVLPLAEVDRLLRQLGYTDGGQLRAADKAVLAEKLGADRLVSGTLTHFDRTPMDRHVAGNFRLWDLELKQEIWNREAAVSQMALRQAFSAAPLVQLIANMPYAFIEQLAGKPLGPETLVFVDRALRSLPLRPSAFTNDR